METAPIDCLLPILRHLWTCDWRSLRRVSRYMYRMLHSSTFNRDIWVYMRGLRVQHIEFNIDPDPLIYIIANKVARYARYYARGHLYWACTCESCESYFDSPQIICNWLVGPEDNPETQTCRDGVISAMNAMDVLIHHVVLFVCTVEEYCRDTSISEFNPFSDHYDEKLDYVNECDKYLTRVYTGFVKMLPKADTARCTASCGNTGYRWKAARVPTVDIDTSSLYGE